MKHLPEIFFVTAFFGIVFLLGGYDEKVGSAIGNTKMGAAVFFTQSTTSAQLQDTFKNASSTKKKLNILIVPGHEPDFGGAEYQGIKERDLNADLALYLAQYLVEDGHYEVVLARGRERRNPFLENYFASSAEEIKKFVNTQKEEMARLVQEGKITTKNNGVEHNDAPTDVALRLYGINKWANEHKVDIILHVHFNDSAPRKVNNPGEYNGFTIYTPERQYSNAEASAEVSKHIFKRLSKMFPVSNLDGEAVGVVEDQELIALGSGNTVDAASVLVEYGYIYEPQLRTQSVRTPVLKELAFQTYLGLADFFHEPSVISSPYESTFLPYEGKTPVKKTLLANKEVLSFQAALSHKGFYPPENYTKNDCPISGLFGPCTHTAITAFQREHNIKGEKGEAGPKTRSTLRSLFAPELITTR
ncbi:MAG: N-acetylmuramoyl-L-alanine amidase [bacterium]|nr:N-acetylmuramoyl-L-alanine amidase [bacterium]